MASSKNIGSAVSEERRVHAYTAPITTRAAHRPARPGGSPTPRCASARVRRSYEAQLEEETRHQPRQRDEHEQRRHERRARGVAGEQNAGEERRVSAVHADRASERQRNEPQDRDVEADERGLAVAPARRQHERSESENGDDDGLERGGFRDPPPTAA